MKVFLTAAMVLLFGIGNAGAAEDGAVFRCDLTNLRTLRVVQSREIPLSPEPVLWLFGGGGLNGTVRDVPAEEARELEITLEYREGASYGRATAWAQYDPADPKNFEGRLAEARMELPLPRGPYSLACFLVSR